MPCSANSGNFAPRLTIGFLLLATFVVLGGVSCGGGVTGTSTQPSPHSHVHTRSLSGQPGSLDPHLAEDAFSYDLLRDLYEGLTASSPEGEVVPPAATAWKVSTDGKTY